MSDVQVIEVDLRTTEEMEDDQELCAIEPPIKVNIQKKRTEAAKAATENTLDNFSNLFDKILLAELTSEYTWMDRFRQLIERGYKQEFVLMGPYTNPLWSKMVVKEDCIMLNNSFAVPLQLRQVVLKQIHRGNLGQEAMLGVSQYLWWPHMHKCIVNLAEECRSRNQIL